MTDLIEKIGPLFWVLCVFAVYGMAVVAERFLYFHRVRINTGDFLRGLSNLIRKGSFAEARHEASKLPGPIARVVEAVISRPELPNVDLRALAQEAAQLEVFKIEKNIRGLLVVATVAPLLGVLGTIMGLIRFYSQLGIFEGRAPQIGLSQAVFEALLTSALGLVIAIPAYLFYAYMSSRARLVIHEVERAGIEVVYLICDARTENHDDKECSDGDDVSL
ncbi:MAG: MotA/TolQ/ExbB proton channel family protein [Akkermansia sp.]